MAQQRDVSQDTYPSSMKELVEQLMEFQSFLQKKFNWAPLLEESHEEDDDEYAPVVVEL